MNANDQRVVHSSQSELWRTPPDLVFKLCQETEFSVDVAADSSSRLFGEREYFGPDHPNQAFRDGLDVSWAAAYGAGAVGFMNPPFSRAGGMPIGPWIEKAWQETVFGFTTFGLIPVRTSTKWWQNHVMLADEIRIIPHRVKFLLPDGTEGSSAPFDSCVVVWRPRGGRPTSMPPRFFTWDYR